MKLDAVVAKATSRKDKYFAAEICSVVAEKKILP